MKMANPICVYSQTFHHQEYKNPNENYPHTGVERNEHRHHHLCRVNGIWKEDFCGTW
jgi:hypothetical protein